MRRPSTLETVLVHVALLAAVAFALYPVLWVVALALSGGSDPQPSALPLPREPTVKHFGDVAGDSMFARQMFNSIAVATATAVVGVAIAVPAAYALARFDFVGKGVGIRSLLATQMFPAVASAIPLYIILDALGLLNSRTGLVLCYASTAVPFAIFQLRAAFESIPVDLEEAAMVDGATRFEAFVRVVLPVARPAIAVTALFAFMSAYNEFVLALTFLDDESMFTLPVYLQRLVGPYGAQWERFAAGSIIVSIPVMGLFYLVQRHLVSGLASGGVKG